MSYCVARLTAVRTAVRFCTRHTCYFAPILPETRSSRAVPARPRCTVPDRFLARHAAPLSMRLSELHAVIRHRTASRCHRRSPRICRLRCRLLHAFLMHGCGRRRRAWQRRLLRFHLGRRLRRRCVRRWCVRRFCLRRRRLRWRRLRWRTRTCRRLLGLRPFAHDARGVQKVEEALTRHGGHVSACEPSGAAPLAATMLPRAVRELLHDHRGQPVACGDAVARKRQVRAGR